MFDSSLLSAVFLIVFWFYDLAPEFDLLQTSEIYIERISAAFKARLHLLSPKVCVPWATSAPRKDLEIIRKSLVGADRVSYGTQERQGISDQFLTAS